MFQPEILRLKAPSTSNQRNFPSVASQKASLRPPKFPRDPISSDYKPSHEQISYQQFTSIDTHQPQFNEAVSLAHGLKVPYENKIFSSRDERDRSTQKAESKADTRS